MFMKSKVFWGMLLLLLAAYLIVGQLGYLPEVGVITIILTGVCIAAFVHGIAHAGFGEMLFSLAFTAILYDEQLGITAITPWTVLLAALLGTIGLNLIFGKMKKKYRKKKDVEWYGKRSYTIEGGAVDLGNDDGENIEIDSCFGSAIRYVSSEDFRCARIDARFSGVTVYFDNAKVPNGNATIDINASFSGTELYVPGNWQIINHLDSTFGGLEEKNKKMGETSVVLTLEGKVIFAGVTVYYL